jgi:hypothetical protein
MPNIPNTPNIPQGPHVAELAKLWGGIKAQQTDAQSGKLENHIANYKPLPMKGGVRESGVEVHKTIGHVGSEATKPPEEGKLPKKITVLKEQFANKDAGGKQTSTKLPPTPPPLPTEEQTIEAHTSPQSEVNSESKERPPSTITRQAYFYIQGTNYKVNPEAFISTIGKVAADALPRAKGFLEKAKDSDHADGIRFLQRALNLLNGVDSPDAETLRNEITGKLELMGQDGKVNIIGQTEEAREVPTSANPMGETAASGATKTKEVSADAKHALDLLHQAKENPKLKLSLKNGKLQLDAASKLIFKSKYSGKDVGNALIHFAKLANAAAAKGNMEEANALMEAVTGKWGSEVYKHNSSIRKNVNVLKSDFQNKEAAHACVTDSATWIKENAQTAVKALTNVGIFDPDQKFQATVDRTLTTPFNTVRKTYNDFVEEGKKRGLSDLQAGAEAKRNVGRLYGEFSEGACKAGVITALLERGVNIEAFCDHNGIIHKKMDNLDENAKGKIFDALFNAPDMKDMGEALLNLQRVGDWMGNNELGARRFSNMDGGVSDLACQDFKAKRAGVVSGAATIMQAQIETLQPKRSVNKWQEQLPDSFKKIQGRLPSSKEVLNAMELKESDRRAQPTLSEALIALDHFNKIGDKSNDPGRSEGLKALATAEHAIYELFNSPNIPLDKVGILMQTLSLIQAQHQELIGHVLKSGEAYPAALIRNLAAGETEADVQALWQDMVNGNKGFSVTDIIPARTSFQGGVEVVAKPEEKIEGFKTEVFSHLARLISTPGGRKIIRQIMEEGANFPIKIQPKSVSLQAGGYIPADTDATEGKRHRGSKGHVELPVGINDITYRAHDSKGSDILFPIFIMVGHELGHAVHGQRGEAKTSDKTVIPAWRDMEEQSTIEGVENLLRQEHGLAERFGVLGEKFIEEE